MNEWQKVKIGNFLKVREGKYKPDDDAIADLKRLNKIDFSGRIHLSDKPTKTDMIIVNSGDLVISGINVAKGAIAVHQGSEPITATIHYSAYEFDESKIDIDFLKRFLKSPAFISALQEQTKGGIKTEIKAKTLLSIVVQLPSLSEQKTINKRFDLFENELIELDSEISNQQTYLTQLRQAILQEAIEGKLTADWRVKNPVQKGNPDYDAQALLATIQAEKQKLMADGKIKKEKPLAPINPDDVPFALPDGWVWVRLGSICQIKGGKRVSNGYKLLKSPTPHIYIRVTDMKNGTIDDSDLHYLDEKMYELIKNYTISKNDLYMTIVGATIGKCGIVPDKFDNMNLTENAAKIIPYQINKIFLLKCLSGIFCQKQFLDKTKQVAVQKMALNRFETTLLPLPPLAEQNAIVERVDRLLESVNALEQQVIERKSYAEQLMQVVLKEAFTR